MFLHNNEIYYLALGWKTAEKMMFLNFHDFLDHNKCILLTIQVYYTIHNNIYYSQDESYQGLINNFYNIFLQQKIYENPSSKDEIENS